ncbi:hypothetical protein [Rugosimonospora africana]|uniref:Uncharacterized protein n=1 Tax=Rugosimonospora africana TaxID=556532 RepID=A0A8J3VRP0_9ACTN|nr:hypothetical protein [Rugosimonospora africana]GIH16347.1 hypothetical protein Raf01_45190 [Rugosimonospora africana]
MTSHSPLPPTLAAWARNQARTNHRYVSGRTLWTAADAAHPGLLPPDPQRLSQHWPIHRQLLGAYVAGLPRIEVGDLVTVTRHDMDEPRRATLTAIDDALLVRVAFDGDDGPGTDVARIAVDAVPVIYYTATITTFDGSDMDAYGQPREPGHGYRAQFGWWDPVHRYWQVHEQRQSVTPDVCPEGADPVSWLADRLTARLGRLASYDGDTFRGAREAVFPGRLTGIAARQPDAVPGAGIRLEDAAAAGQLHRPTAGQRTLTAAGHPRGLRDGDVLAAAVHLGLLSAVPSPTGAPTGQDSRQT